MTEAGAYTIGGLLVILIWGGGWLLGALAQAMAEEFACFVRRHGSARRCAADQHGTDRNAQGPALVRIEAGTRALWVVDVHAPAVESETMAAPSRKSAGNTGAVRHG